MSRTRPEASVSPSSAGTSRTSTAPGPNGSTTRPNAASSSARPSTRSASAGSSSTTSGSSSAWRVTRRRPSHLHPLIDQPLVGGVLVDDDHAVAGLGDDVGLVHLGPRRAERIVDRIERHGRRGLGEPGLVGRLGSVGRTSARPGSPAARRAPLAAGRPAALPPRGEALCPTASRRRRRACGRNRPGPRCATVVEARWPGGQAWAQAAHDQAAHQARIAEPHLGLGRDGR
jgi:hypothetical protein